MINSYFSDTEAVEACICRLNVMWWWWWRYLMPEQPPTFRPMYCGQTVAHLSYCWARVIGLFHVFAILRQNALLYRRRHDSRMPDACVDPCLAGYQVFNKNKVCCCSARPWIASTFPWFDTLLLPILFSNLIRLARLSILNWNSIAVESKIQVAEICHIVPLCIIKFIITVDKYRVNRCVQKKTAFKLACHLPEKNNANWSRRVEDLNSRTQWSHFGGHPVDLRHE